MNGSALAGVARSTARAMDLAVMARFLPRFKLDLPNPARQQRTFGRLHTIPDRKLSIQSVSAAVAMELTTGQAQEKAQPNGCIWIQGRVKCICNRRVAYEQLRYGSDREEDSF